MELQVVQMERTDDQVVLDFYSCGGGAECLGLCCLMAHWFSLQIDEHGLSAHL